MKYRRIADDMTVTARAWQRHGDHPKVRPATHADLPGSSDPGVYGWVDGSGLVLPGDYVVVSAANNIRVIRERDFRKGYERLPE